MWRACTEKWAVLSSCHPTLYLPQAPPESPVSRCALTVAPGCCSPGHPDSSGFPVLQFTDRCCPWPPVHPPPTPP